jgi:hypothetical protein
VTGSKPRIGTEVASVTRATWGGSQVGVTRSRGGSQTWTKAQTYFNGTAT